LLFGANGSIGRQLFARLFNRCLDNGGRFAGTGKGVGPGVADRTLTAAAPSASAPGFPAALGPSAFRARPGLSPVGGDDLAELAVFQQLGHRAQGQAQGSHGGAQAKGLLDGPGGAHLVFAEADAEAAGFPVAAVASTPLTTALTTTAFTTTAFATTAFPAAPPAAEATVLLALGAF